MNAIAGGNGNDRISGSRGADVLNGGNGVDNVSYFGSDTGVIVDLDTSAGFDGDAAGDQLAGVENLAGSLHDDTLVGNGGANVLSGSNGADDLVGRGGADRLIGGTGRDRLSGDELADTYVFETVLHSTVAAAGRDLLFFAKAQGDKIDLSAIDADFGSAGDQAFSFIGGSAFSDAGQVRFYHAGGQTFVEAKVTGKAAPEMAIELNGTVNLTASDFIL